jgi:hypothetical protein
MNTFLIQDSFPIEAKGLFVFAGEVLSGIVEAGMRFEVPEAGHRWTLIVESVEIANTNHGNKVALTVKNSPDACGFLPGLGVGFTTELT